MDLIDNISLDEID